MFQMARPDRFCGDFEAGRDKIRFGVLTYWKINIFVPRIDIRAAPNPDWPRERALQAGSGSSFIRKSERSGATPGRHSNQSKAPHNRCWAVAQSWLRRTRGVEAPALLIFS